MLEVRHRLLVGSGSAVRVDVDPEHRSPRNYETCLDDERLDHPCAWTVVDTVCISNKTTLNPLLLGEHREYVRERWFVLQKAAGGRFTKFISE